MGRAFYPPRPPPPGTGRLRKCADRHYTKATCANEAEAKTRRKLSRRYDLCDDTVVCTATLLIAQAHMDTARWT
jgi:hypothetical protein